MWARGQAWAISGFARAARDLEDPELLAAAVRAAEWWLAHTTSGALPRFDFSSAPDAPRDSSAQAIAGAGLHILAQRCAVTATCDAVRYAAAADVAEATLLARLEPGPQLGRLGEGVYNIGGLRWDERAELPWGSRLPRRAADPLSTAPERRTPGRAGRSQDGFERCGGAS